MTVHQPHTPHPELAPPQVQFHLIDGGETNLRLENLTPKEKVAIEFATWMRDNISRDGHLASRSEGSIKYGIGENSGILDERVTYERTGPLNFLEPFVVELYVSNDTRADVEFYDMDLFMMDENGFITGEIYSSAKQV